MVVYLGRRAALSRVNNDVTWRDGNFVAVHVRWKGSWKWKIEEVRGLKWRATLYRGTRPWHKHDCRYIRCYNLRARFEKENDEKEKAKRRAAWSSHGKFFITAWHFLRTRKWRGHSRMKLKYVYRSNGRSIFPGHVPESRRASRRRRVASRPRKNDIGSRPYYRHGLGTEFFFSRTPIPGQHSPRYFL